MYNTKDNILKIIKIKGPIKPGALLIEVSIGEAMLYRHLKKLIAEKKIEKIGAGPHTHYKRKTTKKPRS